LRNVSVDETAVVITSLRLLEMVPNGFDDQRLYVSCRYAAYRAGVCGFTLEENGRWIVSVFDATFADMAWAHAVAAVIKEVNLPGKSSSSKKVPA
jgi:hypothetical protein